MGWEDSTGDVVYVFTDVGPGSMTTSGYPRTVRRWRRGTPLAEAPEIFAGQADDLTVSAGHDFTPGYERDVVVRALAFYESEVYLAGGRDPHPPGPAPLQRAGLVPGVADGRACARSGRSTGGATPPGRCWRSGSWISSPGTGTSPSSSPPRPRRRWSARPGPGTTWCSPSWTTCGTAWRSSPRRGRAVPVGRPTAPLTWPPTAPPTWVPIVPLTWPSRAMPTTAPLTLVPIVPLTWPSLTIPATAPPIRVPTAPPLPGGAAALVLGGPDTEPGHGGRGRRRPGHRGRPLGDHYRLPLPHRARPRRPRRRRRPGRRRAAEVPAGVLRPDRTDGLPALRRLGRRHPGAVLPGVPGAGRRGRPRRARPDPAHRLRRVRDPAAADLLRRGGPVVAGAGRDVRGGEHPRRRGVRAAVAPGGPEGEPAPGLRGLRRRRAGPDRPRRHGRRAPRHPGRVERRAARGQHAHRLPRACSAPSCARCRCST